MMIFLLAAAASVVVLGVIAVIALGVWLNYRGRGDE
jgi:predicted nucleic acid-binding Zn ribbon protein